MTEQDAIQHNQDYANSAKRKFLLTTFSLVTLSFLLGFAVPFINQDSAKLISPVLLALISWAVVREIVEPSFDKAVDQINKSLMDKFNVEEIRIKQIMDFLSLVQEELSLQKLKYGRYTISSVFKEGESPEEFEARVKDNRKRFHSCQAAVSGLSYQYHDSKIDEDVTLLQSIVATAVDNALSGQTYTKEEFNGIAYPLYVYLRAWLICSIKHDTDTLPIEWIKLNYQNQNQQIDLLHHIKDVLLKDKTVGEYLTQDARDIVEEFLVKLIHKIDRM